MKGKNIRLPRQADINSITTTTMGISRSAMQKHLTRTPVKWRRGDMQGQRLFPLERIDPLSLTTTFLLDSGMTRMAFQRLLRTPLGARAPIMAMMTG